ncbi:MAG: undecaprenyl-diphosphate phosphatase [Pseudomonadota bacterium]
MTDISVLKAIALGVIQGATEFLPISSSAHLVIFQHLFGIDLEAGPIVAFDVCLHIGTLFAVLLALRQEVVLILRSIFSTRLTGADLEGGFSTKTGRRAIWLILLGTLPAVVIGFSFKDFFEHLFTTTLPVGIALIATGCILFATRFVKQNDVNLGQMRWWQAILVGLAQALAIIPGISRSGSTIAMGIFTKLDYQLAAKYSFLLSVIAIGGAAILEVKNLRLLSEMNLWPVILGTLASFIVGYLCVRWMLVIMRGHKFSWFAIYCWLVGAITLYMSL